MAVTTPPRSTEPTTTGSSPSATAPRPGRRPAPRPSLTARLRADATFDGTLALALLTLVVGLGCGRLFTHGRWVGPVVLAVVASHAVAFWCRRKDLGTTLSAVMTVGATVLTGAWTVLGHATAYGVPIPYTFRVAADELGLARDAFQVVKAPTGVMPGFVIALVLAIGVAAFMADWAAFRLQTPVEALVPSFTLFVFTAALAGGHHRALAVSSFVAAAIAFVVVHGAAGRSRTAWFGSGKAAASRGAIARTSMSLGAVAIGAGLLLWPLLPGAGSKPLVKYKSGGAPGPSSRSTVSPLVDIRGRLVEQSDVEVFTVESTARSYWRLTSLDTFNGTIWQSNTKYRTTDGPLGTAEPLVANVPSSRATQTFRVRALSSIWLPAAYRPQRVEGIRGVSYNADTASLITADETTDGYTYVVVSAVPDLSPELLATAPAQAPAGIATRYLQLPALPGRVVAEARRIVRSANATTPYAQARALQDYFRGGRFTYDLNVGAGHSENALERFIFTTRRGYCEQFAGAYAVLARAIGLPARVAVGFTPGELRGDLYHVQDRHAHAWPEVYLHGFGWVAFEPTPGRGAPDAESYTGVPEAQEGTSPGSSATTAPSPSTTAVDDATPSTVPGDLRDLNAGANGGANGRDRGPSAAQVWLSLLLVALVAYGGGVPLVVYLGTRRARRAGTTAQAVAAAWARAATALAKAGIRRRPAETVTEFAARAAQSAGLQAEPARALRSLGRDMALACYAAGEPDDDAAARAATSADLVVVAVTDQITTGERLRWWLDVRRAVRVLRGSGATAGQPVS
jgi:transglutaminase-like putative cysteine protease